MDLPNCITYDKTTCNNDGLGAEICVSIMILRYFTNVVQVSLTFIICKLHHVGNLHVRSLEGKRIIKSYQ